MRILVTGASGLLGLNLSLLMAGGQHTIVGVDRSRLSGTPFELIQADLLGPDACPRLLEAVRPAAVIHTAALANLEACEADPGTARLLNADLPGELAAACAGRSIGLVHISTDSVFDGAREGIYTEDDVPNPPGVYSATKLQGERNVLSAYPEAVVARVNFFGWSLSGKRSLSEYFYNNLSSSRPAPGFTDIWFCPIFVGDLADTLVRMLEKSLSGLYHAVGSEALTKYDFGLRIARRFGFDPGLVVPASIQDSELTARRSPNLRLSVHKLSTALGREIPGVSTGIEQFYTQATQGYPQKMRSYQQV
ncbi:MAG: SDR family oxidoreductase [Chloroflexi bacterium]|nr:SDR family oxidoreductase [Chloroflexota bacterium]